MITVIQDKVGFFNPFPNNPWFLRVCSTSLLKTLWEKEKLLVTSKFLLFPKCFLTFSRTFCNFRYIWNCRLQTHSVWKSLKFVVWERFNPIPNKPWFVRVCSTSLLKTMWEKGEIICNEQFLLFPQCISTHLENSLPFSSNLKLSSAKSLSLERV